MEKCTIKSAYYHKKCTKKSALLIYVVKNILYLRHKNSLKKNSLML